MLSSITNEDGTALLTIQRATDGTGNIVLVADAYGREVFYHDGMYSNSQVPKPWARSMQLLDRVSQIVPTGTNTNPPDRYVYAYQMLSNTNVSATTAGAYEQVPFLHTCSVPSPTGAGLSTYTWNYDATTDFVQSEIDGNGNETDYQAADANGNPVTGLSAATLVTVKDAQGNAQIVQTPTQPVQKPISVKVGAFFPTQSSGRNQGGSTRISASLDYALIKTAQNNPTLSSIYLDYEGGSKHGGHADTYALGVAVRTYTNTPSAANGSRLSPYVGAGIGAYDVDVKNQNSHSANKVGFGGKVLAGLEFSQAYFVEANYQFVPQQRGVNPSGFGLQVGARF